MASKNKVEECVKEYKKYPTLNKIKCIILSPIKRLLRIQSNRKNMTHNGGAISRNIRRNNTDNRADKKSIK